MPNQPERFRDTSLPIIERVKDLLSRLTIEEKIHLLSTHQLPVERLGIGEWYVGQEVARGYVSREKTELSTVFPQPIGLASTLTRTSWNSWGNCRRRSPLLSPERPQGAPDALGTYSRSGT